MSKKKDLLAELKRIERDMKELGRKLREEHRICQAELVDRLRLGLSGEDAIRHYNDWMLLHDLPHLVIE
jgi:hypothetical protein